MGLEKPYYRIARTESGADYIKDKRYAPDRFLLLQAYQLIENDLKAILEYIEPADQNESVFSHRIYELFLRCATEFEANCKNILYANGYKNTQLNIKDYYKVNKATKVSEYEIKINSWYNNPKIFRPLQDWLAGPKLCWYQVYNNVKHDRLHHFHYANLRNVIDAAASVLILLFAQFEQYTFSPYNDEIMSTQKDDDGFWYGANSLFNVKPFTNWSDDEKYDGFNLNQLDAFEKFPFK